MSASPCLERAAPEAPVADLPAALAWYGRALGFRTVMAMPQGDYAIVERDEVAVHLFRGAPGEGPVSFHVFARQLDQLADELALRGVTLRQEIERKPWGVRDFRVRDPFGNEIKFSET